MPERDQTSAMTSTASHTVPPADQRAPWPWLEPYDERTKDSFHGRDADIEQLLRCVLSDTSTVLFGKSGLGKTSLIQAGLAPRLRQHLILPVVVRLRHGAGHAGLSSQLATALATEASRHGLAYGGLSRPDGASEVEALWEALHDQQAELCDIIDQPWTPVFVLDQFEEIFTLVPDPQERDHLFVELGDLIEDRIPRGVARRLAEHASLRERINARRPGARFIVSLREDFLPDLEIWAERIPRLAANRWRLLGMSRDQALDAILKTGGDLVTPDDAQRIATFLAQQEGTSGLGDQAQRLLQRYEPALLSLVCAKLNQDRLARQAPRLDTSNLENRGARHLHAFYATALAVVPGRRQRRAADEFMQQQLITASGTRRPFPLKDAAASGLSAAVVERLTAKHLLRVENTERGPYLELVHDRLALVAAQRAERAAELNRLFWLIKLSALIGVFLLAGTSYQALVKTQHAAHLLKQVECLNVKLAAHRSGQAEGAAEPDCVDDAGRPPNGAGTGASSTPAPASGANGPADATRSVAAGTASAADQAASAAAPISDQGSKAGPTRDLVPPPVPVPPPDRQRVSGGSSPTGSLLTAPIAATPALPPRPGPGSKPVPAVPPVFAPASAPVPVPMHRQGVAASLASSPAGTPAAVPAPANPASASPPPSPSASTPSTPSTASAPKASEPRASGIPLTPGPQRPTDLVPAPALTTTTAPTPTPPPVQPPAPPPATAVVPPSAPASVQAASGSGPTKPAAKASGAVEPAVSSVPGRLASPDSARPTAPATVSTSGASAPARPCLATPAKAVEAPATSEFERQLRRLRDATASAAANVLPDPCATLPAR